MEDIIAILMIFGGGAAVLISFSPVGAAIADRIRGRTAAVNDPALLAELDGLRNDLTELQERVEFSERLLAASRESGPST